MGDGDDTAIVKESNGFHILEVDASNSQGWSWLDIGIVILAIKLRHICLRCPLFLPNKKVGEEEVGQSH